MSEIMNKGTKDEKGAVMKFKDAEEHFKELKHGLYEYRRNDDLREQYHLFKKKAKFDKKASKYDQDISEEYHDDAVID